MQIVVLGMHRSGTSMVTRLVNMMGAYVGPEGSSTGASAENPKGFWERRDIRELNDELLEAVGCTWSDVVTFSTEALSGSDRRSFESRAQEIILGLDGHRPWVIKEPRLCFLFPFWRPLLEVPLCVLVHRSPLQVAHSLSHRNGFSIQLGLALWEAHTLAALSATRGVPRLLVSYEALLAEPAPQFQRLHDALADFGATGLRLPTAGEVEAFVDVRLHRQRQAGESVLNEEQQRLHASLRSGEALGWEEARPSSPGTVKLLQEHRERRLAEGKGGPPARRRVESTREIRSQRDALRRELPEARRRIRDLDATVRQLRRERLLGEERREHLRVQVRRQQYELAAQANALAGGRRSPSVEPDQLLQRLVGSKEAEIEHLKQALAKAEAQLGKARSAQRKLQRRLHKVEAVNREVFSSRAWKFATVVGSLYRLVVRRSARHSDVDEPTQQGDTAPSRGRPRTERQAEPTSPQVETAVGRRPLPGPMADIVICVHSALDHAKSCVEAVMRSTSHPFRLILVDDGSDQETASFLRGLADCHAQVRLLSASSASGYTVAANRGLRATSAELVVLLNSDTVVTEGWLEGLWNAIHSSADVGITGPLSNAASWQSIPRIEAPEGGWAVNQLPKGWSPSRMGRLVGASSSLERPTVPFLNGFCLAVHRRVIETIGHLDESAFPKGFGEENDYCLRAVEAGFRLVVADDVFVYHAKSRSYTPARRDRLAKEGHQALVAKHGSDGVEQRLSEIRHCRGLIAVRQRMKRALDAAVAADKEIGGELRVLFVLPVKGGGGGAHSLVQEALGMRRLGHQAALAVPERYLDAYRRQYPSAPWNLFLPFTTEELRLELAAQFDVLVATIFTSVRSVAEACASHPHLLPAYYVQDYEPWFVTHDAQLHAEALASYNALPGGVLFAKTEWIRETIREEHGVKVHKIVPSLDSDVYRAEPKPASDVERPVRVAAMIRPKTPRRAPGTTMEVLQSIHGELRDRIEIITFGCRQDDPGFVELAQGFTFEHLGILRREEVADLLRSVDIFVDFSEYQAFGRTALEAMACGCAVIVPRRGGCSEFARDGENALVVDTSDRASMEEALERLLTRPELRRRLTVAGLETASRYSIERAAKSELALFASELAKRDSSAAKRV